MFGNLDRILGLNLISEMSKDLMDKSDKGDRENEMEAYSIMKVRAKKIEPERTLFFIDRSSWLKRL